MVIAGIDYSITSPSICVYNTLDGDFLLSNCNIYVNQNASLKEQIRRSNINDKNIHFSAYHDCENQIQRFYMLADWAMSILILHNVDTVSMEAYALGAKGLVFNIAEATGILKFLIMINGIKLYTYPPTFNKKVFSNKGNANKEYMISTFNKIESINIAERLGFKKDFTGSPISDIVDSYSLIYTHFKELKDGK